MRLTGSSVSPDQLSQSIYEITTRVSNETLEVLSHTPLWEDVKLAAQDQNWWFARTEYLIASALGADAMIASTNVRLQHRRGDWARVYASLSREGLKFSIDQDYGSSLLIQVLLEIDDPSTVNVLGLAAGSATSEGFSLLLADPRIIIDQDHNDPMVVAAEANNVPVLRLLLSDDRFDPGYVYDVAIRVAVSEGSTEAVELLLSDPRVDASTEHNEAIYDAGKYRFYDIFNLLISDRKVQAYAVRQLDGYGIEQATLYGDTYLIGRIIDQELLDSQKPEWNPRPKRLNWVLTIAAKSNQIAVIDLLLARASERLSEDGMKIAIDAATKRRNYSIRDLLVSYSEQRR